MTKPNVKYPTEIQYHSKKTTSFQMHLPTADAAAELLRTTCSLISWWENPSL